MREVKLSMIRFNEGLPRLAWLFQSFRAWKMQGQNPRNHLIILIIQ
jgi:hypothetical protein